MTCSRSNSHYPDYSVLALVTSQISRHRIRHVCLDGVFLSGPSIPSNGVYRSRASLCPVVIRDGKISVITCDSTPLVLILSCPVLPYSFDLYSDGGAPTRWPATTILIRSIIRVSRYNVPVLLVSNRTSISWR